MDKRAEAIASDISRGETLKADGERYALETKQALDNAGIEGKRIIEEARVKAGKEYDKIIAEAEATAQNIIKEAHEAAAAEQKRMEKALQEHVANLVISAASKVIEQNMDNEKNRGIVAQFLKKEEAA